MMVFGFYEWETLKINVRGVARCLCLPGNAESFVYHLIPFQNCTIRFTPRTASSGIVIDMLAMLPYYPHETPIMTPRKVVHGMIVANSPARGSLQRSVWLADRWRSLMVYQHTLARDDHSFLLHEVHGRNAAERHLRPWRRGSAEKLSSGRIEGMRIGQSALETNSRCADGRMVGNVQSRGGHVLWLRVACHGCAKTCGPRLGTRLLNPSPCSELWASIDGCASWKLRQTTLSV